MLSLTLRLDMLSLTLGREACLRMLCGICPCRAHITMDSAHLEMKRIHVKIQLGNPEQGKWINVNLQLKQYRSIY